GINHPATTELDPAGPRAGPATFSPADRAGDLELRGRLGEREVCGPQARVDSCSEVGASERFDGACEIGETDRAVDHETFDLMEDRIVAGVRGVAAVATSRHHGVDRRLVLLHQPDLD